MDFEVVSEFYDLFWNLKHFQVSLLHQDFSLEEKGDSEPFWGTSEKTAFSNRGKKVKCKWADEGEH